MGQLPTWWYRTEAFWIDYPHWDMKPELKRYYLMQMAYWVQQLLVLVLGLEKPRKDYYELVAHHIVTIWLVGCVLTLRVERISFHLFYSWSYLINLTLIGNAVYMSMDIPDTFLAVIQFLSILYHFTHNQRRFLYSFRKYSITFRQNAPKSSLSLFSPSSGRKSLLQSLYVINTHFQQIFPPHPQFLYTLLSVVRV